MTRVLRLALPLVLGAAGACGDRNLEVRSKVSGPRVLGVVAEPPEVGPGGVITLHPIVGGVGPGEARFSWVVCARPEATGSGTAQSSFGTAESEQGCSGSGAVGRIPLPLTGTTGDATLTVPGEVLLRTQSLAALYGRTLSAETLRRLSQTVGITLVAELTMTAGQTTVTTIKRVVIVDRAQHNANPPPPRIAFGYDPDAGAGSGTLVTRTPGATDESCAGVTGVPLVVKHGASLEFAPEPSEDAWLETYDTLDALGQPVSLRETAFYSWFVTDGWVTAERSRIPTRNSVWHAPYKNGTVTLWMVQRDGRGGTSACRWQVRVSEDGT